MSKIKQATKKTGRARKEQIVAELVEKFDQANGVVFADYKGLTNRQLEGLKKELKKLDASIVIAKNSLIKLSLGKSQKYQGVKDNEGLNLPTATVFIQGDMEEPLKKIQKAIKDFGLPKIKFGVLEGNLTDEAGVLKIASLPNRQTLLGQLVGTLNSPISGLVITLNANIQKFVMTLDALAKSKPAEPTQHPEPSQTVPSASSQSPEAETAVSVAEPVPVSPEPAQPTESPQDPQTQAQPDQTTTQPDQPTPETPVESADAKTEDIKNQKSPARNASASVAGGNLKNAN